MSLRRYVPTGRGEPLAILAVFGASLVAGLGVGVAEGLVDDWFSLLVIFPLLIGAAAGGLAVWAVARFRLRAPLLAMVLAAAGGTAGYVAVHVIDYLQFRSRFEAQIKLADPAVTDAASVLDDLLVAETGKSGFRGYLSSAARQGVSIKRMSSSDDGIKLSGIGAWIVWSCELLLVAGVAGFLARGRAREPFCETCDTWFGATQPVASGGAGSKPERKQMLAALDIGDVHGAAAVIAAPPAPKSLFAITASTCPRCSVDAYCTLKRLTAKKGARFQTSTLESWLMARDELSQFTDAVARARAGKATTS
jgi:hypothetical protein